MSTYKYQDKNIYYQLDGDQDKPVLLVLNGIMMSTKSWEPFMDAWVEHFSVLRVDFLDQGQSDRMTEPYDQSIQVDLLFGLINELHMSQVNLVGISYGGEIALRFALKYQDKVRRLILFNSSAYTNPLLKDIGRSWIKAGQTRDGELYYKTTIPIIYSPSYYESKITWMQEREKLLTPIFSNPIFLDAMERLTLSAETFDVRDDLKNLNVHTLIVTADEDFLTPKKEQAYLAKQIKHGHWVTLPGVGHASMYESPMLFSALITGFFLEKNQEFNI